MTSQQKSGCSAILWRLFNTSPKTQQSSDPITPAEPEEENLPYRLRDDFLSPAELSFYGVLRQAVGASAVICPKVSLGDLFYPKSGAFSTNQAYRNKIDRKHVDFLLCDPQTLRPVAGIELDDGSHSRPDRQERDRFLEQVFSGAGLPLLRQPVRAAYNTRELAALLKEQAGIKVEDLAPAAVDASLASLAPALEDGTVSPAVEPTPQPDNPATPPLNPFPICPKCGQSMVLRTVKKEGSHKGNQFWGCRDYPRCRGVRPLE